MIFFQNFCISKLNPLQLEIFSIHQELDKANHQIQTNYLKISLPFIHNLSPCHDVDYIPLANIGDLCVCTDCEKFITVCEKPIHCELNL